MNVAVTLVKFAKRKESEDLLDVDERRRTGRTELSYTDERTGQAVGYKVYAVMYER